MKALPPVSDTPAIDAINEMARKEAARNAGKGDRPRPTNLAKYRLNYDRIFRKKKNITCN